MTAEPKKILVIRMSSIGDIILTTPLLRALRKKFPESVIHYLVKQEFAQLLEHNPNINRLITYNKQDGLSGLRRLALQFGREHYDLCIDLHQSLRSRYLRLFSGFGSTKTYSKQLLNRFLLIRFKINLYKSLKPVYQRYFEAVEQMGIIYDGLGTEVFTDETDRKNVAEILKSRGLKPGGKLLVICPGAAHLNKQWLPERFAQVADRMTDAGWQAIFHGGRKETELCQGIQALMNNQGISMAGELSLAESAALLRLADCVLTNDSGLMHLAQSQKVPVVAIFGPTTGELGFFPLPEKSLVIEKKLSCRPCTFKGMEYCPKKHFDCLKGISVEEVESGIRRMEPEIKFKKPEN